VILLCVKTSDPMCLRVAFLASRRHAIMAHHSTVPRHVFPLNVRIDTLKPRAFLASAPWFPSKMETIAKDRSLPELALFGRAAQGRLGVQSIPNLVV